MKTRLVLLSEARTTARATVEKVIADHVFGNVAELPREDMLELRAVLRQHYPFEKKNGWRYTVWLEEIAFAIGTRDGFMFKPSKKRVTGWTENDIMPSMREWARNHGLLFTDQPPQP